MKLWVKHWVTLLSRRFGSLREEKPLALFSIEQHSLGERAVPVAAKPEFRHWMSNIFMYLMPPDGSDRNPTEEKGLVHGWELKIGMTIEEAKEAVTELMKAIELCEKRREERHKQQDREVAESDSG